MHARVRRSAAATSGPPGLGLRNAASFLLGALSWLAWACDAASAHLRWTYRFDPPALEASAVRLRGRVWGGGCPAASDSRRTIRFETEFPVADPSLARRPAPMPKGRYGLEVSAIDPTCAVVARGCTEVVLPRDGSVEVRLTATSEPACPHEARCEHGRCQPATLDAGLDAGADGGRPDAHGPDAVSLDAILDAPDAEAPMTPDAGRDASADAPPDVCVPVRERCNGRDDDRDAVVDDDAGCPCVHDTRGRNAYLFCTVAATGTDAAVACRDLGYDLVTVDDPDENAWITDRARAHPVAGIEALAWWIGLHDLAEEGRFAWHSGAPSTYRNWNFFEPNDDDPAYPDRSADCVVLHAEPRFGGVLGSWSDRVCDGSPYPYICESR
ncbi:MAG: C-type lectin domain-containing protein [Myxococcota bacterium]|nr:C-type lectin domain-containing protein [Myxococcota bacterium]MDW8362221.1 C-type lectin domain-containing protein [Myxococcales bacterium]